MPTGYTAPISDGITFEQYAMGCARAFGALVVMRDEPHDAEIPEQFEPSSYHAVAISAAREQLAKLREISIHDASRQADIEYRAAAERWRELRATRQELRKKYTAMLVQVNAWVAPTADHVELKNFMRSQIEISIEWDCSDGYDREPTRLDAQQWVDAKIESLNALIAFHEREHAKTVEMTAKRNAWLAALRASLRRSA